jgi:hypothetical protein
MALSRGWLCSTWPDVSLGSGRRGSKYNWYDVITNVPLYAYLSCHHHQICQSLE